MRGVHHIQLYMKVHSKHYKDFYFLLWRIIRHDKLLERESEND